MDLLIVTILEKFTYYFRSLYSSMCHTSFISLFGSFHLYYSKLYKSIYRFLLSVSSDSWWYLKILPNARSQIFLPYQIFQVPLQKLSTFRMKNSWHECNFIISIIRFRLFSNQMFMNYEFYDNKACNHRRLLVQILLEPLKYLSQAFYCVLLKY